MSLIVEVNQGKLQGAENKSKLSGNTYYTFAGIPYAKPPIGELRFKPPVPSEKWQGVYDATHERDSCIQKDYFLSGQHVGAEDCLYLNIDTPEVPSEIKVPKAVMVFIHGGGFFTGSGSEKMYGGDFLMNHDVILVRINYRLHVLGFLNLGLEDCPGNAGLRDQALAIKWVKENIDKFGGDPNNITIFGESAGASSVHFQILSPLTKGLFNKAIIQSGSGLTPWALTFNYKEMAFELGERLGFKGTCSEELLQFLRAQPAKDLTKHVFDMTDDLKTRYPGRCTTIPFSPSIEEIKEGAFLPDLPQKLQESAEPLPLIYGVNNKEGFLLFAALASNIAELIRDDFSLVLKYNFKIDPALLPEVSAKIKKYYFGDKEVGLDTADTLVDLYSDIYFYLLYEPIEFVTKSSIPPYVYNFAYNGGHNFFKKVVFRTLKLECNGASHGDELGYLFLARVLPNLPPLEGDDLTVIQNLTTLWTNFAKTGVPTDELTWTPSTSSQPRYLEIDRTLQLTEGKLYGERLQFLKDLLGPICKPFDIF
ncbi:esterase FE4-like [Planococcus citri]|uniref:esterase FE4-like n=1 Tax=Planococcus citri TaxID=170843 RepID=UPI0031F9B530